MKVGEPFRDRIIQFARLDFEGINEPGWSAKTAAELERCFLAGAAGLKINKVLGLDLKNPDGTYIQSDDPRFDPIWEMCAKHNKPVMIHTSDSYGRFLPIGPENERYEAGLWRSNPEGNYYKTGHPTPEVIEKARENMHAKHPKTRFVNAHVAMLYYDMDKVTALLDKYPNADVEISATRPGPGPRAADDSQVLPQVPGPHPLRLRRQSRPRRSRSSGCRTGGSSRPTTSTSITRRSFARPPAPRCTAAGESTASACRTPCCARSTTPTRCATCRRLARRSRSSSPRGGRASRA